MAALIFGHFRGAVSSPPEARIRWFWGTMGPRTRRKFAKGTWIIIHDHRRMVYHGTRYPICSHLPPSQSHLQIIMLHASLKICPAKALPPISNAPPQPWSAASAQKVQRAPGKPLHLCPHPFWGSSSTPFEPHPASIRMCQKFSRKTSGLVEYLFFTNKDWKAKSAKLAQIACVLDKTYSYISLFIWCKSLQASSDRRAQSM